MSETVDLNQLERKAYRASVQDGIMEILVGFFLVLCGIALSLDSNLTGIFIGAWTILFVFFGQRAIERAKRRLTYPRLGKVVPIPEKPKTLIAGIFLFMFAAGALLAVTLALLGRLTTAEWYRWLPLWIGMCFVGASWHLYSRSGRARYPAYAAAALASGIAIGSLRLPAKMDNIALYLPVPSC